MTTLSPEVRRLAANAIRALSIDAARGDMRALRIEALLVMQASGAECWRDYCHPGGYEARVV